MIVGIAGNEMGFPVPCPVVGVRVTVSKLDEIEEENYVTQRDVIRELSS